MPTDLPLDDPWSGLNHKLIFQTNDWMHLPRWIPHEDRRRQTAYMVLAALASNNGRSYLTEDPGDPERVLNWQELGDANLLATSIANAVLGRGATIAVLGADAPLSDGPDYPAAPQPPQQGEMPDREFKKRDQVFEFRIAAWEDQVDTAVERWLQQVEDQPRLIERQEALRDWSHEERLIASIVESETTNTCRLGDGLFVLGWDEDNQRPKVEVEDPNSYFPILNDTTPSKFPERVHLAWGLEERNERGEVKRFVRRITYHLVDIEDLPEGTSVERVRYPINGEQTKVCLLSDGTWPEDSFQKNDLDTLDSAASGVEWRQIEVDGELIPLRDYPLPYDFIPIVHVPHTLASARHFGTSPLTMVCMLLDELQASDTGESLASRRVERPIFAVSGMAHASGTSEADRAENNTMDVSPGMAFKLSESGRIDFLRMADNLESMGRRVNRLLKRLSVNASIPEGLLGRVNASEVPSGFALQISFTSFEQMIEGARLAREAKYELLMKMVQRIQIHHGGGYETASGEMSTEVFPTGIKFGAFMPQDLAGTILNVTTALARFAMSIETGVLMLRDAGVPVEDIAAEVAAIKARMGETALAISRATGDTAAAADFLEIRDLVEGNKQQTDDRPDTAPNRGADVAPEDDTEGETVRDRSTRDAAVSR